MRYNIKNVLKYDTNCIAITHNIKLPKSNKKK